jgi:hypothetical protein
MRLKTAKRQPSAVFSTSPPSFEFECRSSREVEFSEYLEALHYIAIKVFQGRTFLGWNKKLAMAGRPVLSLAKMPSV